MAKKIKKKVPIKPKEQNALLDFIRRDNTVNAYREKQNNKENSKTFFNPKKPSQIGYFVRWKEKDIDTWSAYDFLGLYLNLYLEKLDEEDLDFTNFKNTYNFGRERGMINRAKKNHFNGDNKEFKKYIEFIIDWWISEDSFVTGYPTFNSIFTQKAVFVKIYKESKLKINAKPKTVKRKDIDNKFAGKDAWDMYFEGENNV